MKKLRTVTYYTGGYVHIEKDGQARWYREKDGTPVRCEDPRNAQNKKGKRLSVEEIPPARTARALMQADSTGARDKVITTTFCRLFSNLGNFDRTCHSRLATLRKRLEAQGHEEAHKILLVSLYHLTQNEQFTWPEEEQAQKEMPRRALNYLTRTIATHDKRINESKQERTARRADETEAALRDFEASLS